MYRQGDVLIVRCGQIPPEARRAATDILAKGEATPLPGRLAGG